MDLKPLKIEADLMWAFLDTPNQMSGKYQVDLCNLSKPAIKALEEVGISVRNKEEKGFFITAKSKNYPITTVDAEGNRVTCKVANGSRGVALIKPYAYNKNGKSGVSAGINKLTVTKLIEYVGADGVAADDDVL
jgi:hypothetical protein